MIGTTVSHYEIREKLGAGGMGVVYKAWDTLRERPLAIKFLKPERVVDREIVSRFKREGRNFSRIRHPNLVRVYALGREKGLIYIATEFVDGRNLYTILDEDGPFDVKEALRVCSCAAQGLAEAHAARVVHRDLKPENIMIRNADKAVKVLDFGIAKHLDASQVLTRIGSFLGTAGYSAPEQIRGEEIDHRADIFALGVILYEILTGKFAFDGRYTTDVLHATLKDRPVPVARVNADVINPIAQLIDKMIQKRPAKRLQTMNEVVEKVDDALVALESGFVEEEPGLFRSLLKKIFEE
jgi:serine/threonine-protein kinase